MSRERTITSNSDILSLEELSAKLSKLAELVDARFIPDDSKLNSYRGDRLKSDLAKSAVADTE